MSSYDEDANKLVRNEWAPLVQTPEGLWQRVWIIRFVNDLPAGIQLDEVAKALTRVDFVVSLRILGRCELEVTVTTARWGWDDELYFEHYRMFEAIDKTFGTIDTIQGQARSLWRPWRKP